MTVLSSTDWCHAEAVGSAPHRWRRKVEAAHSLAVSLGLGGIVLVAVLWPSGMRSLASWEAAALLVGGALIGVPHGSSDFVVAHRALRPSLGRAWLPVFLVGYLAVMALVLLGWWGAPLPTLLTFILLSALHFGHGDLDAHERRHGFALAVRATTPLLPVLLIHPAGVTELIALLGRLDEPTVSRVLDGLRWPLVSAWAMAVSFIVIPCMIPLGRGPAETRRKRDALEIGAIAFAAVALPPLLAFALYFCLVHALRHMISVADEYQPCDARRAAFLVAAIVVPSAAVCLVALALAWNGIAGSLETTDVLAWSIRLIAALTVPHMALQAWVERGRRRFVVDK